MRMNGYLKLSSGLPRYAIAAFEAVYSWAESNQRCALGWVSLHVAVLFHWYLRQSMNIV